MHDVDFENTGKEKNCIKYCSGKDYLANTAVKNM